MKSHIRKLGYSIGDGNPIASIYLEDTRVREYGIERPLTKSTILRIEDLGYSSKFRMTAVLVFNEITIFIRPIKEQS